MALTDLLPHVAEVWRRDGSTDRFGQAKDPTSPLYTYPARLSGGRGGFVDGERSVDVYEVMHKLYLAPTVDLREDDWVVVKDKAGNVLLEFAKVFLKNDQWDQKTTHHLEVTLRVQRGPS